MFYIIISCTLKLYVRIPEVLIKSRNNRVFNNPIEFDNIRSFAMCGIFYCTQLCNGRGCYEHPTGFLRADHFHSEIIPYTPATRIYNNKKIPSRVYALLA